jgi:sialidase-1
VPSNVLNESTVVELSDGSLMLNSRGVSTVAEQRYRLVSTSTDSGSTWSVPRLDPSLPEPICQGSILYYGTGTDGKGQILFTNPAHQTSRRHGTLRLSEDDGATWTKSMMYTTQTEQTMYSAYSDIAKLPNGMIALLYEAGYNNGAGIQYRTYFLSDLK